MNAYQSWGRTSKAKHTVFPLGWRTDTLDFARFQAPVLAYGKGRSYGDVCLNDQGVLFDTSALNHFLDFDPSTGLLTAEAGATFDEILEYFVPRGWFLPVTPGTRFITVGGAIANDIHGKNHHVAGTFGCFVKEFELLRSSGEYLICAPEKNRELFQATIGGLGLTGLILRATFQLNKIPSPWIAMQSLRFENLDEFLAISREHEKEHEFSAAWIDSLAQGGASLGRGILMTGDFAAPSPHVLGCSPLPLKGERDRVRGLRIPFDAPSFLLNQHTLRAFNHFYFNHQKEKIRHQTVPYRSFFYPLDAIGEWNRIYGRRGFFQYQCVVPDEDLSVTKTLLSHIAQAGAGSFLTVLKTFGDIKSGGLLSFPKKGVTLALDFPNEGQKILDLLDSLDEIVRASGGRVNPSKDARMSAESFQAFFPEWREFEKYIDPKFSSSFWRRVTRCQSKVSDPRV